MMVEEHQIKLLSYEFFNQTSLGILFFDVEGVIQYANLSAVNYLADTSNGLVGHSIYEFVNEGVGAEEINWKESLLYLVPQSGNRHEVHNTTITALDGKNLPIDYTAMPIKNALQGLEGALFHFSDISLRKRIEKAADKLATIDELTGLVNRKTFEKVLEKSATSIIKSKDKQLITLLIDLKDFKSINDVRSYQVGDQVIRVISQRLRKVVGNRGILGRVGSDTFAILLVNDAGETDFQECVEPFISSIKDAILISGETLFVSCSLGISVYPSATSTLDNILPNAEMALSEAKLKGANSYAVYETRLRKVRNDKFALENKLRQAIDNDAFEMKYQVLVDMKTNKLHSAEALVRFTESDVQKISPAMFIPAAEDAGLMSEVNTLILMHIKNDIQYWKSYGLTPRIGINVSPSELLNSNLIDYILELGPENLAIEITETGIVSNYNQLFPILKRISETGAAISIDDFGTGYSSLSHLKKLPVDNLKIDRTFVTEIDSGTDDKAIVKAMIMLAEAFGLEIIAEGIETRLQESILMEMGCHIGQGYLYSQPLSVREMTSLLKSFDTGTGLQ